MPYLFVGAIAGGIQARVTLLSHRGGWFLDDQNRKSTGMLIFDVFATVVRLVALALSFFLFVWWMPILSVTVGYWLVPPSLISRENYGYFYRRRFSISVVSFVCALLIGATYLGAI